MNTENLSTLIIHKLTQDQYNRVFEEGEIDENALYLTPDEMNSHMQPATAFTLGLVKIGNGLKISSDGLLSLDLDEVEEVSF